MPARQQETNAEHLSYVQAVGLQDKKDSKANALSGGMKRKLQVALALLGNSKVVLLGENPSTFCSPNLSIANC